MINNETRDILSITSMWSSAINAKTEVYSININIPYFAITFNFLGRDVLQSEVTQVGQKSLIMRLD